MSSPKPFKIAISDEFLDATKSKLKAARFPGELELPSGEKWSYGTPLQTVQTLATYWRDTYDWRKAEARLNEMPQFTVDVKAPDHESINVHFVHKRSSRPNAMNLLFIHGWPGNFTEVEKVLPMLTEPSDGSQAYHVVAPSLPGFVFSSSPKEPGFDLFAMAATLNQLMIDLGYNKYISQGGDWGSHISRSIAIKHSDHCVAIHLNMFMTAPPSKYNPFEAAKYLVGGYSEQEITQLRETQHFMDHESGYQSIQCNTPLLPILYHTDCLLATKPQTLNYGLVDSPVAMLAWIREKMETWTDDYAWTSDEILTWVMLYYATGKPATHIYKESRQNRGKVANAHIEIPVGVSVFPKELYKVPRSWAEKIANIVSWKVHDKGGHFAATERPEVLVADFQEFVGILKANKAWTQKAKF